MQNDLARKHNLEDEQRQAKLQLAIGQWNNTTDPTQRQNIQAAIGSLYPTPAHGPQFLSDLLHLKGKQQAAQAAQMAPVPQRTTPASTAPTTDQLGIPYAGMGATPTPSAAPTAAPLSQVAQAPDAESAWRAIAQIPSSSETAINRGQMLAQNAQALERLRAQSALDQIHARVGAGLGITPENRFLQQYATEHGYETASQMPSEVMADAMGQFKKANIAPTWKSIVDGNNVYAVDAHDPNNRQLIGHKADLTQHLEYRTLTNPDGSQYLVPMVTWTKKGSTQPILQTQADETASGQSSTQTPTPVSQTMVIPNPKGLVEPGNLPIWNRPIVHNADGSISTEYSTSFTDDQGREVLVPTVVNGKFLTPDGKKPPEGSPQEKAMFQAAWQHYLKTGENLGKFDNPNDADAYAQSLHNRGLAPPRSANTPVGPSADLSATNQNITAANAASKKLNKGKPKSARTPSTVGSSAPLPTNLPKGAIPFGSKGSPLLKSDTQQYTKLAEDANSKDEALSAARSAAASPSPSSDQELIYSWVRSNVQNAGKMTQTEFIQAQHLGSLPMKAQNWLSMASTGKLTPEIRQMILGDIERSAKVARSAADQLRTQIESEMNPSKQTAPTKSTPNPDLLNRLSQALEGR